ncbi:cold shock and DUF1294 domain-containing protein [Ramlibacter sp. CrO1]|uniref:Cold shock and DUF1294 domain-containing protein n=1 Tax=Ramlibacter algicola TaxID=2795217 RepID=A0A934Q1X6_9BURK|nr:cold shock and DUF1294 domain-containing protein [Ramlibacter algicola]
MKAQGSIVRWDAARGFGFIRSASSSADVFFHIRDMRRGASFTPQEGVKVMFDVIHVGGKGPRAVAVHLPGDASPARSRSPRSRPTRSAPIEISGLLLLLAVAYAAAIGWAVWSRLIPWWTLAVAVLVNLATFFAYWQDKHAAEIGRWRTPEATLHLWSLAGGWPLAHVAQQVLRHKSSKQEFLAVYWTCVVLHLAAVGAALWLAAHGFRLSPE